MITHKIDAALEKITVTSHRNNYLLLSSRIISCKVKSLKFSV